MPLHSELETPLISQKNAFSNNALRQAIPSNNTTPSVAGRRTSSRILDRESRGKKWRIEHQNDMQLLSFAQDWFHHLLYSPTMLLFFYLCSLYAITVFFFGCIYYHISQYGEPVIVELPTEAPTSIMTNTDESSFFSKNAAFMSEGSTMDRKTYCGMEIHSYIEAFYFSLTTMTTIGYGVSDYYFGDCFLPFFLIICQVFSAVMFDSIALGLLFLRTSRGTKRSRSILFSDCAIIRRVRGKLYFMFRIGELKTNHLLNANIRVFCVRHKRIMMEHTSTREEEENELNDDGILPKSLLQTYHYVPHALTLLSSSNLFMAIPNIIIHPIDESSPLMPPSIWFDSESKRHIQTNTVSNNNVNEGSSCSPLSKGHDGSDEPTSDSSSILQNFTLQETNIKTFLQDREAEIVVLVEGIDEMTNTSVQARFSYTLEDVVWNHMFIPCVSKGTPRKNYTTLNSMRIKNITDDACVIDFRKFHETEPTSIDCKFDALIHEGESNTSISFN